MAFPCLRIPPSKESCAPPDGNPKTQEIRHPHPAFLQNRLLAQVKSQRSINRFRILHGRPNALTLQKSAAIDGLMTSGYLILTLGSHVRPCGKRGADVRPNFNWNARGPGRRHGAGPARLFSCREQMVSVFKPQRPKLNFAAPNLFVHLAVNLPQPVPRIAYAA